jgi:hypothetical protein
VISVNVPRRPDTWTCRSRGCACDTTPCRASRLLANEIMPLQLNKLHLKRETSAEAHTTRASSRPSPHSSKERSASGLRTRLLDSIGVRYSAHISTHNVHNQDCHQRPRDSIQPAHYTVLKDAGPLKARALGAARPAPRSHRRRLRARCVARAARVAVAKWTRCRRIRYRKRCAAR